MMGQSTLVLEAWQWASGKHKAAAWLTTTIGTQGGTSTYTGTLA
jgi:hypothetical protein